MGWPVVEEPMKVSCACCKNYRYEKYDIHTDNYLGNFYSQCEKGYIVHTVSIKDSCGAYNEEPNWLAHGTYDSLSDEEREIFESGHCPDYEERVWEDE